MIIAVEYGSISFDVDRIFRQVSAVFFEIPHENGSEHMPSRTSRLVSEALLTLREDVFIEEPCVPDEVRKPVARGRRKQALLTETPSEEPAPPKKRRKAPVAPRELPVEAQETPIFELTDVELKRLHAYNPILAEQIEIRRGEPLSPLLAGILEEWRAVGCPREAGTPAVPRSAPASIEEVASEQGAETRAQVAKSLKSRPKEQGNLLVWCGYPTNIARVSPFFPMNNTEKGRRDRIVKNLKATLLEKSRLVESSCYLINELVSSGPWGEIIYTGPKLSIEEEDALMALLVIIEAGAVQTPQKKGSRKSAGTASDDGMVPVLPDAQTEPFADLPGVMLADMSEEPRPRTFSYRGPVLPILRLMGHKRPGTNHYNKLLTSLKCLALGSMQLFVREQGSETQYDLSQILSNLRLKPQQHEISVTVNPFFYQMYLANSLTWIDIAKRFQIRGSISKALYRFCQSHRENPVFRGNILTLTQALNMDPGTPLKETRRQIRDAISELVEKKVLEKTSTLMRNNLVILNRRATALPSRKKALKE